MSKVLPHSPILIKNSNTLQYDRDLSYSHHCPYLPRHPSSLAPQPSLSHVSLTNLAGGDEGGQIISSNPQFQPDL